MAGDYSVLAPIYNAVGMADYAGAITPRLLSFAQMNDWLGRRVYDLGCGTGQAARTLAQRGLSVTGIESSPEMLAEARRVSSQGLSLGWKLADARALDEQGGVDLVFAIDLVNEFNSLRDLEALFNTVHKLLEPEKLFIFDLHTIEGLAARRGSTILTNTDTLSVVVTHAFDYEVQATTADYLIFRHGEGGWTREKTTLTARGFPIKAVAALLQRCGFGIMALMDTAFEMIDLNASHEARAIFVARKP